MSDWWSFGIACAALVVAIATGAYNRRSANSAERSEKTADKSVTVAEQARDEARRAADAAEAVHKLERDRNHEMFAPVLAERKFTLENHNGESVWFTFTASRDYTVTADAVYGSDARSPLSLPKPFTQAGIAMKVFVEALPSRKQKPLAQFLEFRFMPAGFDCFCGRDGNKSHWVVRVPVEDPRTFVDVRWV